MIRRARRDGREARGIEEREERGLRKGAIVSSSPQGMTSWSSNIKIWFFQAYTLYALFKKRLCHDVKQNAKVCAIDEQNVIN